MSREKLNKFKEIVNANKKDEVSQIKINVNDQTKIVEVWLTNADQNDASVSGLLELLYAKYKEQKYKVAVFKSGKLDLVDRTAGLLIRNRGR